MSFISDVYETVKFIWSAPKYYVELHTELSLLQVQINQSKRQLRDFQEILNERVTVHADVSPYTGKTQVVVIGQYKKQDFVRMYVLKHESIYELVELLREIEKHAEVGRFDFGDGMKVSAVYPHERL